MTALSTSPAFGVLLVNLGTPDAPTPAGVRKYLKEFLSDPRVVDVNPWLWQPILNLVILNLRSAKVAKLYQKVWMDEGSPLLVLGERLCTKVALELNTSLINKGQAGNIPVVQAMTYGSPSIDSAMDVLRNAGVDNILVLPMYPQFSATTTAAVYDKLMAGLKRCSDWPSLTLLHDYADHPLYVSALANSVRCQWQQQGEKRHLVFSYHGIPKRYVDQGDPYAKRCWQTSILVAEALGLDDSEWTHVYQSRFGREEWLQPYANVALKEMVSKGITDINIMSPAFAVDCLETLEEVTYELGDEFQEAGGGKYDYIAALNDSADQVGLFCELIRQNTLQWSQV